MDWNVRSSETPLAPTVAWNSVIDVAFLHPTLATVANWGALVCERALGTFIGVRTL